MLKAKFSRPRVVGAAALLLVAWLLATALKYIITRVLKAVKLDDRLFNQVGIETSETSPFSETMGNAVYWLFFILFLPAILGALGRQDLLFPVQNMIDEILGALPDDLVAAGGVLLGLVVFGLGLNLAGLADRVISEAGVIGQYTELTLLAKSRFGKAAEMRPRLLSLIQERLEAAGIQLVN